MEANQGIAANEATRPLKRAEYDQLVELGVFDGERLELLWGFLVPMSPQGEPHSWVIEELNAHFVPALAGRARVRVQCPLAVSDDSEPEPDLAIVGLADRPRAGGHPSTAWLVVEVSRTTQRLDRKKTALYAAAGVNEVWLVDVPKRRVEVYTQPSGGRYERMVTLGNGDRLVPTAFPDAAIDVDQILPTP